MSDDHSLELVIGGQPHLRCTACGFRFNFHGRATVIAASTIALVHNAHKEAPHKQIEET